MYYNNKSKAWKFLFIAPLILAIASAVVMLLWNAILPTLIGVKFINYWQSAGLLILCKILFGNYTSGKMHNVQYRTKENFMSLTAEQREKLKAEWQKRCQQKKES